MAASEFQLTADTSRRHQVRSRFLVYSADAEELVTGIYLVQLAVQALAGVHQSLPEVRIWLEPAAGGPLRWRVVR